MPEQREPIQSKREQGGQKFPAQHADAFHLQKPSQAPQSPTVSMKTNSLNQYRGHGRGQ